MRKSILMLLLLALSSGAAAEWTRVGRNRIGIVYADPTTISRAGNLVTMWDLADYTEARTVSGKPHLSMRTQYEYDCEEQKSRLLEVSAYSGNMARGEAVFKDTNPRDWRPNPPDSGIATLWKFACGK